MRLTLSRITKETKEVYSFTFIVDTPLLFQPGQHISIFLPHTKPDARGVVRTFSISSSPITKNAITITTKRGPSSFKRALFQLPFGSTCEARGPSGGMVLDKNETNVCVMIAGGIGITPFMSMILFVAEKKLTTPIKLFYSNKNPEEIIFRTKLDRIQKVLPNLNIIYTITELDKTARLSWSGRVGRIDEILLRDNIIDMKQSLFFVAGSTNMVETMTLILSKLGVSDHLMRFEKFSGY